MEKPFSPSCERNQQVILEVLKTVVDPSDKNLLEIGSGTGQHAVFMAPKFMHLIWHTSDLIQNHDGIFMWMNESSANNIQKPIEYQAGKTQFPKVNVDIVYTANTLHIMSWENVQQLIIQLGESLLEGNQIFIYGPFKYGGKFTSESNANFDVWLKQQNYFSGIRDFESVVSLMLKAGMSLVSDIEMPANNRILHFVKNK